MNLQPIPFKTPVIVSGNFPNIIKMQKLGSFAERFFITVPTPKYNYVKNAGNQSEYAVIEEGIFPQRPMKTAWKVAIYILSCFIFPLLMLIVKGIYRYRNKFVIDKTPKTPSMSDPKTSQVKTIGPILKKLLEKLDQKKILTPCSWEINKNYLQNADKKWNGHPNIQLCINYLSEFNYDEEHIRSILSIILQGDPIHISLLIRNLPQHQVNGQCIKQKVYQELRKFSENTYSLVLAYVFIADKQALPDSFFERQQDKLEEDFKTLFNNVCMIITDLCDQYKNKESIGFFAILQKAVTSLFKEKWEIEFVPNDNDASLFPNAVRISALDSCIEKCIETLCILPTHKTAKLLHYSFCIWGELLTNHYQKVVVPKGFEKTDESEKYFKMLITANEKFIEDTIDSAIPPNSYKKFKNEFNLLVSSHQFPCPFHSFYIFENELWGGNMQNTFEKAVENIPYTHPLFFGFFLRWGITLEKNREKILEICGLKKIHNKENNAPSRWQMNRLIDAYSAFNEENRKKYFPHFVLKDGKLMKQTFLEQLF